MTMLNVSPKILYTIVSDKKAYANIVDPNETFHDETV